MKELLTASTTTYSVHSEMFAVVVHSLTRWTKHWDHETWRAVTNLYNIFMTHSSLLHKPYYNSVETLTCLLHFSDLTENKRPLFQLELQRTHKVNLTWLDLTAQSSAWLYLWDSECFFFGEKSLSSFIWRWNNGGYNLWIPPPGLAKRLTVPLSCIHCVHFFCVFWNFWSTVTQ